MAADLTSVLVAGGFTTLGVVIKTVYDGVVARVAAKRESAQWLADDRRKAYDDFLLAANSQTLYVARLLSENDAGDRGLPPCMANASSMHQELSDALRRIHKLARNYSVIEAAEGIQRTLTTTLRLAKSGEKPPKSSDLEFASSGLVLLLKGRIDEFTHAYREDLGLGLPTGAPKRWPVPGYIQGGKSALSLDDLERWVNGKLSSPNKAPREPMKPNAET